MRSSSDFDPHDANLGIGDLDALSQRPQVVAAVAAALQPDALANEPASPRRATLGVELHDPGLHTDRES